METDKRTIRKEILKLRNSLSEEMRAYYSSIISGKINKLPEYNHFQDILIYASYQSEVITDDIINDALKKGKNVYLPRVEGEDMSFYMIGSRDELISGSYGIREPEPDENKRFYKEEALMIMPLSVFDRQGNRLGYGKGFYDRFLSIHKGIYKIGIAYHIQEHEIVPEKTDIKMDMIETDKESIVLNEYKEVEHDRF